MRMITPKIRLVITFLFLLCSAFLYADTGNGFSLEVRPVFQFRDSSIGEYVYIAHEESPTLLSDIQWSLDHYLLSGAFVSYRQERFSSSITALFGIPGSAGRMTDADFYTSSPEPTLFSSHDASIISLFDVSVSAGYDFVQDEKVRIECFTSLQYNETHASSYDGYLINNYGSTPVVQNFTGQIISYTQYLLFAWLGSNWYVTPSDSLTITLSMAYSPFCFAKGWDIHHLRDIEFLDSMKSFYALKGGISLAFFLTKKLSLNAGVEGVFLPKVLGLTGAKAKGDSSFFEQPGYLGGTSLSEARFSVSVCYTFLW